MPKDVATFLANLAECRRAAQLAERSGFVPASGLVLPGALEVALRHRFLLTPVLARSRLATTSPPTCLPSCEREQRDDDSWQRSLHFIAQGRYHFLFESAPRLPQLHGYPDYMSAPTRTPS